MSNNMTESLVNSILQDKEVFMDELKAAMASKVQDAFEIRKVELASTLISPEIPQSADPVGTEELSENRISPDSPYAKAYLEATKVLDPKHHKNLKTMLGNVEGGADETDEFEKTHLGFDKDNVKKVLNQHGLNID